MLKYDEIIKKATQGISNKQIAQELGCKEFIVRRCYRSHILKLPLTAEEKELMAEGGNCKYFTELIRKITEDKIITLYNANASLAEIAEAIGTTKTRVCQILRELASKEDAKITYEKRSPLHPAAEEPITAPEPKIFKPKKIMISGKKYLDVTALYIGA